jgi:hypothetical protein
VVLVPAFARGSKQTSTFQHIEVLGNRLAGQRKAVLHRQSGAYLEQRLGVPLAKNVQNGPSRRRIECFEDISHGVIIGKYLLACQGRLFLNNLPVVLDGFFVHRSRTIEGKDGNPLNKCRMICTSFLQNHGVMGADNTNKSIKYTPEKSVVKLKTGDEIKLTESAFVSLFNGFLAEIEAKFTYE